MGPPRPRAHLRPPGAGSMNARREVARRMSEAAAGLLGALDAEQQALASWPFPADDERRLWYYTPTDHGGLPLSAMRPAQQRRAMQLVSSGLSRAGYVTVVDDHRSGQRSRRARRLGRRLRSRAGSRPGARTTCACSVCPTSTARGGGGSGGTTSRSTTPSSTARWSDRHRASSALTRHRRRCSVRTRCGRSPVPKTSAGSSSTRSTTRSAPPRSCLRSRPSTS